MSKYLPSTPGGEFLLYQTEDGRGRIEVRMQGETVWLTQQQMAESAATTAPDTFDRPRHGDLPGTPTG